ncbi:MAG: DMT family transporter [Candidatus Marinimicrobia bacterium]|nr:DMT family transporter [Candidatus Neomarinimicrobiota bacterium]
MNTRPPLILLYLLFFVNVLLFGSSWMFNKMVLEEGASPIWAAAVRQSIAALVFLLVFLIKRPVFKLKRQHLKLIVFYGVFMMALAHVFAFSGQDHIGSGLASIVFSFFPLAIVIISSLLIPKSEPLTLKKVAGTLIGLAGIVLIFYSRGGTEAEGSRVAGIFLILISVFVNALPNVIIKRDGAELDPLVLNTGGFLIAAPLLLLFALIFEGVPVFTFTRKMILSELYLGILCSALAFFLYFYLLRHISVFKMSLSAYLTPVVAVLLGYLFFDEKLSADHYIGMFLIFTGIFITEIKQNVKRRPEIL